MIDISELIDDPDFAAPFAVTRVTNSVVQSGPAAGELAPTHAQVGPYTGVIQPNGSPDALLVLPEGLRSNRAIVIWARERLYNGGDFSARDEISDYITHDSTIWRVFATKNWSQHGYWQAWATECPDGKIGVPA